MAELSVKKIPGPVRMILFVFSLLILTTGLSAAKETIVRVNAPQLVSGDFTILITIDNALDLDSGQCDLIFDPDAIQVLDVNDGDIGATRVPVDLWASVAPGRVRVLFNFPGVQGISGTGHLAEISARAVGKTGQTIRLSLQKGLLVDQEARSIPARWLNGDIEIEGRVAPAEPDGPPTAGEAPEADKPPRGVTLSTPLAIAGLGLLAVVPGLLLVLLRKKKGRG